MCASVIDARALAALLLLALAGAARAEPARGASLTPSLGVVAGLNGRTPGGFRLGAEYARPIGRGALAWELHGAIMLGQDEQACYFDRTAAFVCDHGALEGRSLAVGGGVLYRLGGGARVPYLRGGGELGMADFPADDTGGPVLWLRGGGGLQFQIGKSSWLRAEADVALGFDGLEGRRGANVKGTSLLSFELGFGVVIAL